MIEINHTQAKRLIRDSRERLLQDDQWAILQAHLETCADCRTYQNRLAESERRLSRTLHNRWNSVNGPHGNIGALLITRRKFRKLRRKQALGAGLGALVLLLLVGYVNYVRVSAPLPPEPTPTYALGQPTPTPPITFRGVLAVETVDQGSTNIALLSPGPGGAPEMSKLTGGPGDDIAPAWSPDGEWIAFLSNRSGKYELYTIHISGTKLTQLTNNADVDWQAPLSWSADGKWIGLTGKRISAGGLSFVYLVPLNGQGARTLGFTRGASGPLYFSPAGQMLAYASADHGGLTIYRMNLGTFFSPTSMESGSETLRVGANGAFAWLPDGDWLSYLVDGPYDPVSGQPAGSLNTQVKLDFNLSQSSEGPWNSMNTRTVYSVAGIDTLRGMSWSPDPGLRLLAFLGDPDRDGCWTIQLRSAQVSAADPTDLGGLCVDSLLDGSSWTSDGQWLVVVGHLPGEQKRGYFAVHAQDEIDLPNRAVYEWLAKAAPLKSESALPQLGAALPKSETALPKSETAFPTAEPARQNVGEGQVGYAVPRVRPVSAQLGIMPKAAKTAAAPVAAQSAPVDGTAGQLVYSELVGAVNSRILTLRADGRQGTELVDGSSRNTCPVWSPGGGQIAFLSNRSSKSAQVNDVFVMDANGERLTQLTQADSPQHEYQCPIWSPDGTRLVAVLQTVKGDQMVIIPTNGGAQVSIPLDPVLQSAGLAWEPGSERVLVVTINPGDRARRLMELDLAQSPPSLNILQELTGANDILGMTVSPGGAWLAFIQASPAESGSTINFKLVVWDAPLNSQRIYDLPSSEAGIWFGSHPLTWLANDRLAALVRHNLDASAKTDVFMVSLTENPPVTAVIPLEDEVYNLSGSPDGKWLAWTSESGMYTLNTLDAEQGQAAPFLLSLGRAFDLDWR